MNNREDEPLSKGEQTIISPSDVLEAALKCSSFGIILRNKIMNLADEALGMGIISAAEQQRLLEIYSKQVLRINISDEIK